MSPIDEERGSKDKILQVGVAQEMESAGPDHVSKAVLLQLCGTAAPLTSSLKQTVEEESVSNSSSPVFRGSYCQ